MRIHGKIKHWNHPKAYGFITPATGDKEVFVHISSFQNKNHRPAKNQRVTFEMSTDRQGRPCAKQVAMLGEESTQRHKRNDKMFYFIAAIVFLAIVAACAFSGMLPLEVLLVYLGTSLLSFIVYAWDKNSAQRGAWRIKESTLHLLGLLGGWPGAMVAQQVLRHKSAKEEFRFVFWLTVIVNCAILIWLFTDSGRNMLETLISQLI